MPASTTSDEDVLLVSELPHHGRLWFDDGSIVLATRITLFKVYSGILSQQSSVFRDIIHDAESRYQIHPEQSCLIDGHMVVHVEDDPVQLGHFLLALFDRSYYCHDEVAPFSVIAALLRLSTKYRVDYLRDRVIRHLSTVYPDTLQDYLARADRETLIQGENSADFNADLINLANEINARQLLPFAFYWAAVYKLDMDFRSTPLDNSDVWEETCGYDRLSYTDLARICFGAQKLQRAMGNRIGSFLKEQSSLLCHDPEGCTEIKKLVLKDEIWSEWRQLGEVFDPNIDINIGDLVYGLCTVCDDLMHVTVLNQQREVWEELPSYFDLPNWPTLRKTSKTLIAK